MKVYKLQVIMRIQEYEIDKANPGYERFTNSGLTVEETVELGNKDFMEMMGVMGEMHKAIQKLSKKGEHAKECNGVREHSDRETGELTCACGSIIGHESE